jgi:hypothetical protein
MDIRLLGPGACDSRARRLARTRARPRRAVHGVAFGTPAAPLGHAALISGALAFALCLAYALIRYVVLKGEPLASVPLYVTNKAVALFGILLIAAAAARPNATWRRAARGAGLFAAALHALASVVLLRPAYLAKLHAPGGRLSGPAELAVICGVAALVAFASLRIAAPVMGSPRSARWAARGAIALVGVHCAALGARGWVHPASWPGGLPPLTLLGALAVVAGLALGRRADPLRDRSTSSSRAPSV